MPSRSERQRREKKAGDTNLAPRARRRSGYARRLRPKREVRPIPPVTKRDDGMRVHEIGFGMSVVYDDDDDGGRDKGYLLLIDDGELFMPSRSERQRREKKAGDTNLAPRARRRSGYARRLRPKREVRPIPPVTKRDDGMR